MGLQAIFSLKVFDYPFDVEVGDGLPGFPGLEPAAFLFIGHKSVLGQDCRAKGFGEEVEGFFEVDISV